MPDDGAAGGAPDLVRDVRQRLTVLPELPCEQHVELFDGVHRSLQDALAHLDEG